MRNKLIPALLVAISAGAASAQVAGSAESDTNALRSSPATNQVATSSSSLTNSVLSGPGIDEQGMFDLGPMPGEPFVPSRRLWSSDVMEVDGGAGRPFVDTDGIRVQRETLFYELDLLLRADTHDSPVYFGVDHEVKFVEPHDFRPGIPVPIGLAYRGQKRLAFFTELAPIFDAAPTDSLGWGGGIGIRFSFGR